MAELARRPALCNEAGALRYDGADFTLRAVMDKFITRLQWRPAGGAGNSRLEQLTQLKLPDEPLQRAGTDPAVFWCAPGEWLIVGANVTDGSLRKVLGGLPDSVNCVVTDSGCGLACIRMAGDGALPRLARGCSAPLEHTAGGHYLLTRLFGMPALVHKVDDSPAFDLYIDRTTSRYLWDCLLA